MKNVRIFALIMAAIILQSCSTVYNYLQVVKTQPTAEDSGFTANSNGFEFRNEDLVATYRMWSENGRTQFFIYNLSNEIIYVDLAKSFFIRDGFAFNYYEETTYSETHSSNIINTSSSSYSEMLMASKSASVSNYYLGNFGTLPLSVYSPVASSASLSASRSAAVSASASNSVSVATGKSSTIATKEQQIVAIPPMSGKYIDAFQIADGHLLDCNLINYPSDKSSIKYTKENSPISFTNYITYKVGDNSESKTLRHEFYISEVSNYVKPAYTVYEKRDKRCDAVMTPSEAKSEKNAPDVYDAYISVPTDGCFYNVYKVTSSDKLYKTSNSGPYYYWSSQYNGYTTTQESSNNYGFFVPRMEKK